MGTGWRWEPREVRGGTASCPRACVRGQLPTAKGTIGSPLIKLWRLQNEDLIYQVLSLVKLIVSLSPLSSPSHIARDAAVA